MCYKLYLNKVEVIKKIYIIYIYIYIIYIYIIYIYISWPLAFKNTLYSLTAQNHPSALCFPTIAPLRTPPTVGFSPSRSSGFKVSLALQRHQCHQVYLRQIRNNHIRNFIGLESSRLH